MNEQRISGSITRKLTRNEIFKAAKKEGLRAALAHTLAECLYWFQYAQHKVDGEPAVYKTGPELSLELGVEPRTINRHFKRLAEEGFWKIRYRPRPHHPSPVSWLIPAIRSMQLLDRASKASQRRGDESPSGGSQIASSNVSSNDAQLVQVETLYTETTTEPDTADSSFGRTRIARKNEAQVRSGRVIRAPTYLNAGVDLENFVGELSSLLEKHALPKWDMSSRFTWQHAGNILRELREMEVDDPAEQLNLLEEILDRWAELRPLMSHRYASHHGNLYRPTPMALAEQFEVLISAVTQAGPTSADGSWGHSNLDQGFH